jgi:FMN phosphatase YigB (HAD superfamily)
MASSNLPSTAATDSHGEAPAPLCPAVGPSGSHGDRSLEGVIIAFDLDNTLLDPTGVADRNTIRRFLSSLDPAPALDEGFLAWDALRARADSFDRLGLRNPRHEPGNPHAVAAFFLTYDAGDGLSQELRVDHARIGAYNELLVTLCALDIATRAGPFAERLAAERRVRQWLAESPLLARLREDVIRLADHPVVLRASAAYHEFEAEQPVDDWVPLFDRLCARGARTVIISEGRVDVQSAKLRRLGLANLAKGRALISEAAATVPGQADLEREVEAALALERSPGLESESLQFLWYYQCVPTEWRRKTPSFYGRCLHALALSREKPAEVLCQPAVVPPEVWKSKSLRFVMVGDRYDLDVLPLLELVGRGAGHRIRLVQGKYAHCQREESLAPDRRPDRSFGDWPSLESYLLNELTAETVPPISHAPSLLAPKLLDRDFVRKGRESPLPAVRFIASALAKSIESHRDF